MNILLDFYKKVYIIENKKREGILFMATPTKEVVLNELQYIQHDLYNIVVGAWQDWLKCSEFGRTRFSRTRANIVWERMIDRAYEALSDDSNIEFIERNNTVFFVANNCVLFRFKKGDITGLSHNYPTQTAIDFHDHSSPLFEDMFFSRVEVVYALNNSELQVEKVFIIARDDEKIIWHHELLPRGVVVNIPTIPIEPQKTTPEPLVEVAITSDKLDDNNAQQK
jgi:hypothetical protein